VILLAVPVHWLGHKRKSTPFHERTEGRLVSGHCMYYATSVSINPNRFELFRCLPWP